MLAKFSVKKPLTIIIAVLLIILLGAISFLNMKTDLLPEIDLPYVVVMTTYPGASPEKVETAVTKPLESTLATTGGVEEVTSISQENTSMIIFQLSYGTNMDSVIIDMNNKLNLAESQLGDEVGTPILMQINPDMLPIMVASVDIEGKPLIETSQMVSDVVIPQLERVEGVASVEAMGSVENQLTITLNQDKIDDINEKVLKSIDEELYDAQQALDDAEQQLESGKQELEKQTQQQNQALIDAEQQIDSGKEQIGSGVSALTATEGELKQQKQTLETQKEQTEALIQATQTLNEINEGIQGLETSIGQIDEKLQQNQTDKDELQLQRDGLQDELDALPETPENEQKRAELEEQIAGLDGDIQTLEGDILTLEGQKSELSQRLEGLQTQKGPLDEILKAQDYPTLEELEALRDSLQEGIDGCDGALSGIPGEREKLDQTLQQLEEQSEQLQMGKNALTGAQIEATVNIALGEQQLSEQQAQLDEAKEEAYQKADIEGLITQQSISQILTAENFSMPAGYIVEGEEQFVVKVGDAFATEDELKNLELFHLDIEGVETIKLSDVADIAFTDNAGEMYAKINGNDGVLLTMQKQSTNSTAEVSQNLRQAIEELMEEYPDLHITTLSDQGIYIDIVIQSVIQNLLMGAALAMIVLFFFIKSIKPTLIVAVSIPISLMLAIVLMYFTGINLNIISLAGLALGIGMLVDNSIVVIENIFRLRALGVPAAKAAVQGAKQVAGAIAASTLTTICVFLPIIFTEGISKELFTDMGLTIGYSLIASLLVALSLVPTLTSTTLRSFQEKPNRTFERFKGLYGKLLEKSLRHKAIPLIGAVLLFVICAYGAFQMGLVFMPESDSSQIMVNLTTEEEMTQQETRQISDQVAQTIEQIPGVQTVGAMQSSDDNAVSMYIVLEDERQATSSQITEQILNDTKEYPCQITASASTMDLSAMGGSGLEVEIRGDDLDTLQTISKDVAAMMESIEGTLDVSDGMEDGEKETHIVVDKNKALSYGLTVAQVYQEISSAIQNETTATTVTLDEQDYPVIVAKDPSTGLDRETLGDYSFTVTQDGEEKQIALKDIATIEEKDGLSSIQHANFVRTMTVTAEIDGAHNINLVSRQLQNELDSYDAPEGYSLSIVGENETIVNTVSDLLQMVALAIVLIYFIMVAQFQSWLSPMIVMFTIPLALTGGMLGLWITGMEISTIALLGFLVLCGVVVNNGIVFVDCANQLRAEGMEKRQALVEAGKRRIRPILMTAITTILGLLTLAFGIGQGADMLQPMAIVIIFGLTYATLLTLFIVPSLYDIFHRKKIRVLKDEDLEDTLQVESPRE